MVFRSFSEDELCSRFENLVARQRGSVEAEQSRPDEPPEATAREASTSGDEPFRSAQLSFRYGALGNFFHRYGLGGAHSWVVPQKWRLLSLGGDAGFLVDQYEQRLFGGIASAGVMAQGYIPTGWLFSAEASLSVAATLDGVQAYASATPMIGILFLLLRVESC